jgi:sugar-specific transcriptional regulator TrmB
VSLDRVSKILEGFGFSKADVEVYIYLAKRPPTSKADLAVAFGKTQHQIHQTLRRLSVDGVVKHSKNRQMLFSALPFEELIERYVKFNMEQAKIIEEAKEYLLKNGKNRITRYGKL